MIRCENSILYSGFTPLSLIFIIIQRLRSRFRFFWISSRRWWILISQIIKEPLGISALRDRWNILYLLILGDCSTLDRWEGHRLDCVKLHPPVHNFPHRIKVIVNIITTLLLYIITLIFTPLITSLIPSTTSPILFPLPETLKSPISLNLLQVICRASIFLTLAIRVIPLSQVNNRRETIIRVIGHRSHIIETLCHLLHF